MSRTQAATCIAVVVCACAAAINYVSLQEVAVAARIDWRLAYLSPITIDGLGLAGLVAVESLSGGERVYAWCVVVVAFCLSLAGGAAHSLVDPNGGVLVLAPWQRAAASAVAGLSAFGTMHLLVLIRAAGRAAKPAAARERPTRERRPERLAAPPLTVVSPVDHRVAVVRAWLQAGDRLSNAVVASRLGVSRATGGRVLSQARGSA